SFHVHKAILCASSGFLRAATKPEWTGLASKPINLGYERPAIFKTYIQWLYTGEVSFRTSDSGSRAKWVHLAESYILGEKLIDPTFQSAVMDMLLIYWGEDKYFPSKQAVRIMYEGTPVSSPGRMILVDM
ncbi:hypothetical protein K458DRAFT_283950, partial [Lentithecium fluviatile CBS 122367]